MATKDLLAELADHATAAGLAQVSFESGGGVAIAAQVREGAAVDLVVLATGAVRALADEGHVVAATISPLFVSEAVVAVPAGAVAPDISSEDALRAAMLAAGHIGYSTGPSGDAVLALLDRWGVREQLGDRLVQARPGVPVGSLIARGETDLGIQQASELVGMDRVHVLGPLPAGCEIVSVFTGAVASAVHDREAALAVLDYLGGPAARPVTQRHGMTPAARS